MGEPQRALLAIFHKLCQRLPLLIWVENDSSGIAEDRFDLVQVEETLMSYYKTTKAT